MLIKIPPRWALPERAATPEAVFFNRRAFMKTAAAGALALSACDDGATIAAKEGAGDAPDPTAALYPAPRNGAFTLDREITPVEVSSSYNNFYEFGSHKRIARAAQALDISPWEVVIDGEVANPMRVDAADLIAKMPLEERLYRHRCVEAWAMAVPWTGFPLKALIDLAEPKSGVRYVRFETFLNPEVATGQKQSWYPWPYVEGLTMKEAMNDLAFMVTGVYGEPLLKQFGAPLRLAVPWKYGFKSIKSIVRISFVIPRPETFWNDIQPREYGFWANVNPDVSHPRWSQATEELIGTGERVPTQLFNGYAEEVAGIYKGLEKLPLYR